MTEEEWLSSLHPMLMLELLELTVGESATANLPVRLCLLPSRRRLASLEHREPSGRRDR